jgi:hypothetical protein
MLSYARCALAALLMIAASLRAAEAPPPMHAAEIRLALKKLDVLGRALYVATHPDDENTGPIAHWANGALHDTAYLSLTRGAGASRVARLDSGHPAIQGCRRAHEKNRG